MRPTCTTLSLLHGGHKEIGNGTRKRNNLSGESEREQEGMGSDGLTGRQE